MDELFKCLQVVGLRDEQLVFLQGAYNRAYLLPGLCSIVIVGCLEATLKLPK